jgi:hypothetical protein
MKKLYDSIASDILEHVGENSNLEMLEGMSTEELLRHYLEWNGIIGFTGSVMNIVRHRMPSAFLEAENKTSATVIMWAQYPNDKHLELVLIEKYDGSAPYVIWTHNNESGGFHMGDYHQDRAAAVGAFLQKVADMQPRQ